MTKPEIEPVSAIAANHRHWFDAQADRMGAPSFRDGGVSVNAGVSPSDECHLPFPTVDAHRAGAQLDAALAFARAERPGGSLLAWGTSETAHSLGVPLMARGLRLCFQPLWMWRDLLSLPPSPPDAPNVDLRDNASIDEWTNHAHPYFGDAAQAIATEAEMIAHPAGDTICVVAWQADRPVGVAVAHLTEHNGTLIAGIFNVGVVPEARNRRIGGAVTDAVCRLAQERGASFAGLNATPMGEPVYRRLGFVSHGFGQTWIAPRDSLGRPAVDPTLVAWTEALGFGNLSHLGASASRPDRVHLSTALPCGLTPVQFAASAGQPAAVEHLLADGATLDPLSAWELGWHDRIAAIVVSDPSLRAFPTGEAGGNALHQAVLRDDLDFVTALLMAGAETDGKDPTYGATPIGWADHLGRIAIAEILRSHSPAI